MKNVLKKLGFACGAFMASMAAAFAAPAGDNGLCALIQQMHGVFVTLRTLAFVGAAFTIAGWAWGYISKGDVKKEDLKDKGIGMLVGFVMLFGIGVILQFFLSSSGQDLMGCKSIIFSW